MHLIEEEFLFEGGKAGMSRKRLYLRGGGGGEVEVSLIG